jgi:gliding motility-associated transport system ATP-binding protein
MIQLKKVSKKFDSNLVIDNLSLKVKKGEVLGFLGPNGAGKTTTTRMIAGVLPPSRGEVLINNKNVFAENIDTDALQCVSTKIGYLPESNPLYEDMTVEEFLHYWADLKSIAKDKQESQIRQAVQATGLQDVYYRPIEELSKGFRQRCGLAQAILGDPDILLLDEPTEGLDPNQRRDIHKLISGLGAKRTVVICSHVLSEITRMCSRIIIINQGQIVADSPTDEISSLSKGEQIYEIIAAGKTIQKDLESLSKEIKINKTKHSPASKWTLEYSGKKDLRLDIFNLAKKKSWKLYELTRRAEDLEDIFANLTK